MGGWVGFYFSVVFLRLFSLVGLRFVCGLEFNRVYIVLRVVFNSLWNIVGRERKGYMRC